MVGALLGGLALLTAGAELLVRGASKLAVAVGISPLLVGLTVVAYGTSTPELAVSVQAGLDGRPDVAVGNVVGSNIFNVLLTLGVCALLLPLAVAQQLVRREVPIMIGASALLLAQSLDGRISITDGVVLLASLVAYTAYALRAGRQETRTMQEECAQRYGSAGRRSRGARSTALNVGLVLAGLAVLVGGARWFVDGAVALARTIGVSELVIGLTVVAAGTSLPEVATSIIATIRGERDIAVGNVIGSNIYNILAILGISSVVTPGGLTVAPAVVSFDLPVMVAVAVACLPIFFSGMAVARWEGAVFLGYYVAYLAYLILDATGHDGLPAFSAVMTWFVVPLTALTLALVALRARGGTPEPAVPPGKAGA